jgi:Flp pilus assembly protein TadB
VLALVFFSWLEERALAKSLGHRTGRAPGKLARWVKRKLRADLGKAPRVPWLLAAVLVVAPLILLAGHAPGAAVPLIVLLAAAPVLYARFER